MSSSSKAAKKLSKSLTTPDRLARLLEWKQNSCGIASLSITDKGLGIAISDDSSKSSSVETLEPVIFQNNRLTSEKYDDVTSRLQNLVDEYKIGAFVVGWPALEDGRAGKTCGHVLHFLDHLAVQPSPLLSAKRPFVLWASSPGPIDSQSSNCPSIYRSCIGSMRVRESETTDRWGRSQAFVLTEEQSNYLKEQKTIFRSSECDHPSTDAKDTSKIAEQVLQTFLDTTMSQPEYQDDEEDLFAYRYTSNPHENLLLPGISSSALGARDVDNDATTNNNQRHVRRLHATDFFRAVEGEPDHYLLSRLL